MTIVSRWDGSFFNKVATVFAEEIINKKLGRNGGMK